MPHDPADIEWWRENITIDHPQGKPDRIVIRFPEGEHVDLRNFTDGHGGRSYIVVVPRPDTEPPPPPTDPSPLT